MTHGHGDHYGGAAYLARKYGAHVVMGDEDWKMTETKLDFETPLWDPPPKRDISAKDGNTVSLGGTTVTLFLTPGHTMGTMSPVFDVTWKGEPHRVVEWGGTGFNFGNDTQRLNAYVASTERMRKVIAEQNIDVMISNHSGVDLAPRRRVIASVPQQVTCQFFTIESIDGGGLPLGGVAAHSELAEGFGP